MSKKLNKRMKQVGVDRSPAIDGKIMRSDLQPIEKFRGALVEKLKKVVGWSNGPLFFEPKTEFFKAHLVQT